MSKAIDELRQTIARLRAPGGCPWDIEQTHQSLTRCLIDEVSELLETIDKNDLPHMREELGDVLIQVIFHSQIASEQNHFDLDDVAREVNEKLIRRHPHVFGDNANNIRDTAGVLSQWEQIKLAEKQNAPRQAAVFKNLPPQLPALMFAEATIKQIAKNKLPAESINTRQAAALAENLTEQNLGEQLFLLVAAAREKHLDPEAALRRHTQNVIRHVEAAAQRQTAAA